MFTKTLLRSILALLLWTGGVCVYARYHDAGDKTPLLLAVLIGLFTIALSATLVIWGLVATIRGRSEKGLPILVSGLLIWLVAFILYLISAMLFFG